ncbi:phosphoenolpyruvate--protein phosphotransferase [Dongia soli]|uniref:Phosphoenolpyruvate-protein phosphotransferase n=1 Tax=Dongia soli TaxID=600628 RepID=A0ABU5EFV4_9PROT|nr:phosphoenolpyruvate--protein phosphotransferase [Dongia soli]MDY0885241.1 phosphoenolpyruvate--protein phosphotransferase [Dongia soli]
MLEKIVRVALDEGLHARPAAQIVKLAKSFDATVEIVKGKIVASGKSAVKIMLLGAKIGEEVTVRASGVDADAALDALVELISGKPTDRTASSVAPPGPAAAVPTKVGLGRDRCTDNHLTGVAASAGIAIGPVWLHIPESIKPAAATIADGQVEPKLAAFRAAVDAFVTRTATDLARMKEAHPHGDVLGAEILTALINLANDPDFITPIETRIGDRQDPVYATLTVGQQLAASFRQLDDGYFTARADDIEEIARQIAAELLGLPVLDSASLNEPCILVASNIGAIDFSRLPADRIKGLVCLEGAATSHLAILARSLGIPAVLGLATDIAQLREAKTVALDGGAGLVVFNPSQTDVDSFLREADDLAREREILASYAHLHARTLDGVDIEIAANLNLPAETTQALKNGAMGVGLLRTEFLFLERRSLPSEDEQLAAYLEIARQFDDRPVIIRTLDVGGDKPLPGLSARREENPFLGWRGVRLCLDRPDIFKPQLRALLRAAAESNVKIMIPMVSDIGEIREVKALLSICAAELAAEGKAARLPELGIMIETPAAVMCATQLAEEVGFFSIGTNDLTQYTMAADRLHGNPRLRRLCQASHPAVLRMIELTCQAARAKGIWVGVCGEAAGDPALIPTLLSYGVTEFSMESSLIPRAKKLVMESRAGRPA